MNVLSGKTALVTSAPRVTGRTLRALAKFPGLLGYPQSTSGASFRGFEGAPARVRSPNPCGLQRFSQTSIGPPHERRLEWFTRVPRCARMRLEKCTPLLGWAALEVGCA